jgi:dihydroxyacetone kinase
LEQVRTIAQYAIDNSATLGVALDHCHVPGSGSFNQLEVNELELGMGIHNEAGFLKTKMMEAKPLVQKMMGMLTDQQDTDRSYISLPKEETSRVVLLVNNLGATALVELNLVVKEAVEALLEKKSSIKLERVYVGCFVTSLNMPGFSLSLLKIQDDKQLSLLDEKVHVTGWPLTAALSFSENVVGEEIKTNSSSTETQSDGNAGQGKLHSSIVYFERHKHVFGLNKTGLK